MKRYLWVLVLSAVALTGPALAVEKYDASVVARGNKGLDFTYRFTLEIEKLATGAIVGQIRSWNSKNCPSALSVKGELRPTGEVKFATEESPVRGCGKWNFTGRWDGDSTILGKMNFQGEVHEFVFKRE